MTAPAVSQNGPWCSATSSLPAPRATVAHIPSTPTASKLATTPIQRVDPVPSRRPMTVSAS